MLSFHVLIQSSSRHKHSRLRISAPRANKNQFESFKICRIISISNKFDFFSDFLVKAWGKKVFPIQKMFSSRNSEILLWVWHSFLQIPWQCLMPLSTRFRLDISPLRILYCQIHLEKFNLYVKALIDIDSMQNELIWCMLTLLNNIN